MDQQLQDTFFGEKKPVIKAKDYFMQWALPIFATILLMFIPVLIVFAVMIDRVEGGVNNLAAFTAASRESRIRFQAEQNFLLCSRDIPLRPEVANEINKLCEGYETLDRAYATERARQTAATDNDN